MGSAGIVIGRDRVTRWKRSPDAGSGGYTVMSDAEFDAFCDGLERRTRASTHDQ